LAVAQSKKAIRLNESLLKKSINMFKNREN
jgi:hypothetical protein